MSQPIKSVGVQPRQPLGPIRDLNHDPTWPAARAAFINQLPPNPTCGFCHQPITGAVTVDHYPPYAITGNHDGLRPAHRWCNSSAGGKLGNQRKRLRELLDGGDDIGPRPLQIAPAVGSSAPATGELWQVPWLVDLLDVPADATWPRFMTAPHPRAVGSLGQQVELFEELRTGVQLRWWQRLWLRRQLEVDDAGRLVWAEILATVARQVGKSYASRALMVWRTECGAEQFGDAQLVLHVSKAEAQAREIQRPYQLHAMTHPDTYKVLRQNGNYSIEHLRTGSRWLIKAMQAVYGYTGDLNVVDEAWAASPAVIDDALVPTMLEREQAQLLLVSTAHRAATGLILDRRAAAIADLAAPAEDVLLLEWSAHPDREDSDEQGWREASPHWSEHRRKLIGRALRKAQRGESVDPSEPDPMVSFRTQYLNQWPSSALRVKRGQPLLPAGLWDSLATSTAVEAPDSALVVAVEDTRGDHAAAVAAVTTTDGRLAVWGEEFTGRLAALDYAMGLAGQYDGKAQLLVGASMAGDPALRRATVRVEPAGSKEFRTGLPLLRSLVGAGRLVHDGARPLADQIDRVRVLEGQNGLSLVGGQQADLLRALVWAVQQSTVRPWVVPTIE